jgi:hypothetical protein
MLMSKAAVVTTISSALLSVVAGAVLIGCVAPPMPATGAPQPQRGGTALSVYVTFYGAADNDPPGSDAIAFPRVHRTAGGTGTYADPVTFATRYHDMYPPGTRIYVPRLAKYFVMEDDCECRQPLNHVDLWTGGLGDDRGVLECEHRLQVDGNETIVKDPDADQPVDTHPLYTRETGCYVR